MSGCKASDKESPATWGGGARHKEMGKWSGREGALGTGLCSLGKKEEMVFYGVLTKKNLSFKRESVLIRTSKNGVLI